jgi:hemerythrin-like domain-containing protein
MLLGMTDKNCHDPVAIAMKAVDCLKTEHDLIELGLNLLAKAVARLDAGQPLPEGFPEWAPRLFQQFANQCHHAKEKDVFFPVLKQRGIPEKGGPIDVMLHEHVLGQDCVGRMREASRSAPLDARTFADAARQYIPLLRQHISKPILPTWARFVPLSRQGQPRHPRVALPFSRLSPIARAANAVVGKRVRIG